ncbi:MAG: D-alanyl-D-alanine carboxypeptidase [Alphaproteobacteria bacterium]|nr:D-alanyl-D-alanine carboxypeptidase [Alphaproteobacteria bacterium]
MSSRRRPAIPALLIAAIMLWVMPAGLAHAAGPSIIVDVASGKVLDHKDAFKRWYPASLTKLMTAYVVFRQVQSGEMTMNSPVTISKKAAKAPPSKMYFKPGSQLTLDNALKIILVKSANDVSIGIGESVAGSNEQFIAMMNAEARRLGMTDTRFVNSNGLPGEGQSTTARDMAVLGVALHREFPEHMHYFALEAITSGKKTYTNYNILIGRFSGANGMKTGFICSSGFNQVSSATRNGRTIVSVVLGAKDQEERANESAMLLTKGFNIGSLTKPTLTNLKPYGKNRRQIADLRESICSTEARKARYGGRDVEGRLVLNSTHLKPLNRAAKAVPVRLTGRIVLADVPIPTPRPNFTGSASASFAATSLKPAFDVPVPTPRPSL